MKEEYAKIVRKYAPLRGQGRTFQAQICAAINKLVYGWENNGDVFDNRFGIENFNNDISSYANWLSLYVKGAKETLDRIKKGIDGTGYEEILNILQENYLNTEFLNAQPKTPLGDIYDCEGEFEFDEDIFYDEEDEDWYRENGDF